MDNTWLAALIAGLALGWLGSLLAVRRWTRRQLLQSLRGEALGPEGGLGNWPEPTPADEAAGQLIAAYRRRYLLNLWPETQFNSRRIMELGLDLVQEVARVYYPEEERPEFKASLTDLVALYNRIGDRLQAVLETLPLRTIKDIEIQTVLQYHQLWQQFREHPVYRFLKRHHLDTAARWAWMVKNYANPWYWGRRAAYASGKEVLARLFLARAATIIGEEAMRLYSRRTNESRHFSRYRIMVQELVHLHQDNGRLPAEGYRRIAQFILESRSLNGGEKLTLLEGLEAAAGVERPAPETIPTAERKKIGRTLGHLLEGQHPGEEGRQKRQAVLERWGKV